MPGGYRRRSSMARPTVFEHTPGPGRERNGGGRGHAEEEAAQGAHERGASEGPEPGAAPPAACFAAERGGERRFRGSRLGRDLRQGGEEAGRLRGSGVTGGESRPA